MLRRKFFTPLKGLKQNSAFMYKQITAKASQDKLLLDLRNLGFHSKIIFSKVIVLQIKTF